MSTPIAHFLAGAACGAAVETPASSIGRRAVVGGALGVSADLDFVPGLLVGEPARFHHTITHSLAVALLLGAVAAILLARDGRLRWGLLVFLGYGSHLLLDFLTFDPSPPRGIPLLWPAVTDAFLAPVALLPRVLHSGEGVVNLHNLALAAGELVGFGALLVAVVLLRTGPGSRRVDSRDLPSPPPASGPSKGSGRSRGSPVTTLRILVLAPQPFFQPRGTPIAVRALVETLARMGHEVDLLVYHEGADVEIPGVTVHRIPGPPGVRNVPPGPSLKKLACDALMLGKALRLVGSEEFDLVHGVEEGAFMALLLRHARKVPFVFDMDSSIPEQLVARYPWSRAVAPLLRGIERRAVRASAGVMAVCPALEATALAYDPEGLVALVQDFSLLDGNPRGSERIAETTGRPGPFILYVGNLERYQGIDLLLEGLAEALALGREADLAVIGGRAEHVLAYRRRASDLGIGDRVHFLGPRPLEALGWYLRQAEVLVSPRLQGTNTPMKIYSYLDSGVPVLATRLPTHTQVLDDEVAVLADPEPRAFGRALASLLGDRATRERIGTAARVRAGRDHSREAFARRLEAFYEALGDRIRPRPTDRSGA